MITKIRVKEFVTGTFIVQSREPYRMFWQEIGDQQFVDEVRNLDVYDDIDFEDLAVRCAMRMLSQKSCAEYIGVVRIKPPLFKRLRNRVRIYFTGPVGPCGAPGMMGAKGDAGTDGKARGALDLQCPKCFEFLQDEPRQELKVKIVQRNHFYHDCAKCGWGAKWRIVNGLPIPLLYMRK